MNVPDAEHMRELGCALGRALIAFPGGPLVIFLRGELGAGKTTLVGGVLYAIGFNGPARSPTYTLIEPYETASKRIFHLDLYRLADPHEVEALGLRDLLTQDAILLIEWPERGGDQLPQADLTLTIRYSQAGDSREVVFTPWGLTGDSLASTLRDRSS
ncbi:MAG: tRNA (adenosine(37)-N6)-threonylcarbamoyltransferase complex ATPase subunit type 1 TsaE [Povalibacter sp.]